MDLAAYRLQAEAFTAELGEEYVEVSILDDPDCAGRWTCSHTLAHSAIAEITGSRKSFG